MNYREHFIKWLKDNDFYRFINYVINVTFISNGVINEMLDSAPANTYIEYLKKYHNSYGYKPSFAYHASDKLNLINQKLNEISILWHVELYRTNPKMFYDVVCRDKNLLDYNENGSFGYKMARFIANNERYPTEEEIEEIKRTITNRF